MKQVTERVYMLIVSGAVNFYLIEAEDGLALVDTGMPKQTFNRLRQELPRHGFSLDSIKTILITHAHMDHIGGLPELQAALPESTTAIGAPDAPVLRGEDRPVLPPRESLGVLGRMMYGTMSTMKLPTAGVDRILQDGDTLEAVLPGLRVVALPGHSPGQVGFWWEPKRLLFGGDALFNLFRLSMPPRSLTADYAEAARSIQKVAAMQPDTVCVGHGPVIEEARSRVEELAARVARHAAG